MTRTLMAALAALVLVPASAVAADNLAGQASVIDGDTLEIHGTRIRLWGIDAPESSHFVGVRTADSIGAERRRRTASTHSSPDGW
jgi:endonuclease YncB( thermonuclease family)